jgi:hypothetical protein
MNTNNNAEIAFIKKKIAELEAFLLMAEKQDEVRDFINKSCARGRETLRFLVGKEYNLTSEQTTYVLRLSQTRFSYSAYIIKKRIEVYRSMIE